MSWKKPDSTMHSIRVTLLKWLITPLVLINLIGAALTYGLAWIPAQTAFDQSLADGVWALVPRIKELNGQLQVDLPSEAEQVLRVDHFDSMFFVVRTADGKPIAGDHDFPLLQPSTEIDEPFAYDGYMRGEPIRITAIRTLIGNKQVFIGAAETLRKREHIRNLILSSLIVLEILLTLILIGIMWIAVTKGLLPLKKMQSDLGQREHNDLSLLESRKQPLELQPVSAALNDLLDKVRESAAGQQNFLADVAHQLRTPLAGIKLQLEWLQPKLQEGSEMAHSTRLMMSSTQKMIRQTNQLLALARAEPSRFEKKQLTRLELGKLVESSIQHFVTESDKKGIDLGFDLRAALIMGDPYLLSDMIDNLIDNAIRYSHVGATVTVRCHTEPDGGGAVLTVEDSGPGIALSDQELVFSRFYRVSNKVHGSGLGLSIVRDIANDHGAAIKLTSGGGRQGTIFAVHFPPVSH